MQDILKCAPKGLELFDEYGRTMGFPTRQDYIHHLRKHGVIKDEAEFVANDHLTEMVYLDWLRRRQVGCVFAQLLARPLNRTGARTIVARGSSGQSKARELAMQIAHLVDESVADPSTEALSVLLPQLLRIEMLAELIWELSRQPHWIIEKEHLWRKTLVLIGLRVDIADGVVAETLGMGPFQIFPTTRQCPVTTLEIRTKSKRSKKSKSSSTHLAAHLADIKVDHMLTPTQFRKLSKRFTPWLKKRILGGKNDGRAKASVTYSIPAVIWHSLKANGS